MKKYIKSIMMLLLGTVAFTACSSNDDDYQWASVSGEQVYFSNELAAQADLSLNATTFTVPVSRVNTSDAITVGVQLTVEDETAAAAGIFSAPSSVSFAAGQSESDVVITYDPAKLDYDKYIPLKLTITSPEYTNQYGATSYKVKVGVPAPYTSLGNGTFTDNFLFEATWNVDIRKNDINPNMYRIYAPFKSMSGAGSDYMELTLLKPGDKVYDTEVTQTGLVYFSQTNTGYHHSSYDADVYLLHPAEFQAGADESTWLHSYVVDYQADGTPGVIQLAPRYYMFGVGGWNQSQNDDVVTIVFPGFYKADYSATYEYNGVLTDPNGTVFATGSLTLGVDATNAYGIVVAEDDDEYAVADAIANGDVEATALTAGTANIPIAEGQTGNLKVVIVILDMEGKEARTVLTSSFEWYGGGANPWVSLGTGYIHDTFVITMFYEDRATEKVYDPKDYEVEILENTETPGLYRLVEPFKEAAEILGASYKAANVDVNATDAAGVYITEQATGIILSGEAQTIATWGGYMLQRYDFATLKEYGYFGQIVDGVIYFPVFNHKDSSTGEVDYTYQGIFGGYYAGVDNDEFTITLPTASASAKAQAKSRAAAASFARRLNGMASIKQAAAAKRERLMGRPVQAQLRLAASIE